MVSRQEAHLHQPEGVGLVLLGQGCLRGCEGSSPEAAPREKARAARGRGQPAARCFLCLDPLAQGAPAGWPSTEVGTFVWRLFLPEDSALGQTCPGAGHLSPGPSRQGRAEKGLHPWQAQVASASVGCGRRSLCQRACCSGRGPADSSVCDEGTGPAQGQEKSSRTRRPQHAPRQCRQAWGKRGHGRNLAGTRGLWFVNSLLSRNTARSVVFRHIFHRLLLPLGFL